jgi:hypothetical protein
LSLETRIISLINAIGADIKALYSAVGGSGIAITTIEVDLGLPAKNSGMFSLTGLSGLTADKQVIITQATGPYTGKGILADECEMDKVVCSGVVKNATTIDVYWNSQYKVLGNFKFNYFIQ